MSSRRLFTGFELPPPLIEELLGLQKIVRQYYPESRITRPESLHITLKFLGSVPEELLPAVEEILTVAALRSRSFTLAPTGLDAFPSWRRPNGVVVGFTVPDELRALYGELQSGFVPLDIQEEQRALRPHVTLARFKMRPAHATGPEASLDVEKNLFEVRNLVLFESKVGRGGSVYSILRRWPLGA
jgi:2'-5' RNA ligase